MVKIAPSILSADFSKLGEEINEVVNAGADWIHIDVMDGHFVPNITIGPLVVQSIRPYTSLPLDVHLMIENPDRYIPMFAQAGADLISVHAETCIHLHRTIQLIKAEGCKAGVVLNPATPLSMIEQVLMDVDYILLMTVNPGFGGQKFISSVLPKIKQLREKLDENNQTQVDIQVDGGINVQTASEAVAAGANILVAGNAVFGAKNRKEAIWQLRSSV